VATVGANGRGRCVADGAERFSVCTISTGRFDEAGKPGRVACSQLSKLQDSPNAHCSSATEGKKRCSARYAQAKAVCVCPFVESFEAARGISTSWRTTRRRLDSVP